MTSQFNEADHPRAKGQFAVKGLPAPVGVDLGSFADELCEKCGEDIGGDYGRDGMCGECAGYADEERGEALGDDTEKER